ncbi:hypothetical protein F4824DRAFT_440716 [Ustulina deusta]|nr:hypothetical protein F4824DRAFT_440716 [Ustulina deusta]
MTPEAVQVLKLVIVRLLLILWLPPTQSPIKRLSLGTSIIKPSDKINNRQAAIINRRRRRRKYLRSVRYSRRTLTCRVGVGLGSQWLCWDKCNEYTTQKRH